MWPVCEPRGSRTDRENVGKMAVLTDIRPPRWRLAKGVTPEAFIGRAEALRATVDAWRGER